MTNFILIDGNSIGFSAQFSNNLSYKDSPTQAIYGVMRTVRSRMGNYPDYVPIVFWDGKSWRYDHHPEYKAGRDADPKMKEERDAYKAQRPSIAKVLSACGVPQVMASNQEADDMLARYVADLGEDDKAVILSGDKDMIQLVRPGVHWQRPITKTKHGKISLTRVDDEDFAEQLGYENPRGYLLGKLMIGDSSDKIGDIKGIGDKAAPMIVKHWGGSLSKMIKDVRENDADAIPKSLSRYRKKIIDFCNDPAEIKRIARDYKLMQLLDVSKIPEPINSRFIWRGLNKGNLQKLCDEFGFDSVLRNFEEYVEPFESIQPQVAAYVASKEEKAAA